MRKWILTLWRTIFAFIEDDGYAKASALSYYTLLSVVPLLAVLFGITRGFGMDTTLEEYLLQAVGQQQVWAHKVIGFARSALNQAQGSLIAGVGALLLLWSSLGLFSSIEQALNGVWKVTTPRSLLRRITDYLAVLLLLPLFLLSLSNLAFFIVAKIVIFSQNSGFYPTLVSFMYLLYYGLLIAIAWLIFAFVYIYVPNREVPWTPCVWAALFAACAFQLLQWCYIHLQFFLTGYNAIYGSFAAIPLFLLWLQLSWIIVISGAECARCYVQEPSSLIEMTTSLLLKAMEAVWRAFHDRRPLIGAEELAHKLHISHENAHNIVVQLEQKGALRCLINQEGHLLLIPQGDPLTVLSCLILKE